MEEIKKIVEKLKDKETFNSAVSSTEFLELINVLYNHAEESGLLTAISERIAKELSDGNIIKKESELPEGFKNLIRAVYIQGLIVGLNLGRILTTQAIEWAIKTALARIDKEEEDLRLKIAKIFIYFFKDNNRVNEVEKRIMKILEKQGFSYREIAKVVGRSLETIHRHLKV